MTYPVCGAAMTDQPNPCTHKRFGYSVFPHEDNPRYVLVSGICADCGFQMYNPVVELKWTHPREVSK